MSAFHSRHWQALHKHTKDKEMGDAMRLDDQRELDIQQALTLR
jgi:hypothetical protein